MIYKTVDIKKQCLFNIRKNKTTMRSHGLRLSAESWIQSLAQWAESDPDLAIGISVCSHIITRADGYKFTSNTMAIHHRDIIKVMPIAPAEPRNKCLIEPPAVTRIQTLWKWNINSAFELAEMAFTLEIPAGRNDGTSYKLEWSERLWAQAWTLVESNLNC